MVEAIVNSRPASRVRRLKRIQSMSSLLLERLSRVGKDRDDAVVGVSLEYAIALCYWKSEGQSRSVRAPQSNASARIRMPTRRPQSSTRWRINWHRKEKDRWARAGLTARTFWPRRGPWRSPPSYLTPYKMSHHVWSPPLDPFF